MKKSNSTILWFAFALIVLIVFLFLACEKKTTQDDPSNIAGNASLQKSVRPNVIFLLVDTLRSDFVGKYGAKHATPIFDMLASQGVMFENAYAPSSWTVPSIASIFTGMYPQRHGLVDGVAVHVQVFKQQKMPDQYETVAESFKKAGYTTFCVTTNAHLDPKYGYDAGFDYFSMYKFQGAQVLEQAVSEWKDLLEQASKTTGYFLYLHWIDPHHPYAPQEPYISRIRPDYLEKVGRTLDDIGPEKLREMGYFKDYPETLSVMKDVYNSEVLLADDSVGKVLKILPDIGRSMIVFTSDHGEAFNEHNSMLHGYDLFQETLHVPLFLIYPDKRGAGTVIKAPVNLVDLPPTLLSFANIKAPSDYQGVDLSPLITGGQIPERKIWAHLDKNGQYRWEAVFENQLKYSNHFASAKPKERSNTKKKLLGEYLFDLSDDPGETKNILSAKAAEAASLKTALQNEMKGPPLITPEIVERLATEELRDKFRSHGYLQH